MKLFDRINKRFNWNLKWAVPFLLLLSFLAIGATVELLQVDTTTRRCDQAVKFYGDIGFNFGSVQSADLFYNDDSGKLYRLIKGSANQILKVNSGGTSIGYETGTPSMVSAEPANANIQSHISNTSNPHNVTASQVGALPATSAYVPNILINGNFDVWQRMTDSTAVSTTRTYVPDRFAVTTGAGTLAHVIQSTTTPANNLSRYSLELQGAEGVTTVDVDQRIEAANIHMVKGTVSFSAYVYNGSGSAFTPTLFMGTPSASDNFTTVTVRNNGGSGDALQECADSAWTQVSWTADISAYTDLAYGLEVRLQIPSGSLVASDTVRLAQVKLERSSTVTVFLPLNYGDELKRCVRYFERISAAVYSYAGCGSNLVTGAYVWIPFSFKRIAPTSITVNGNWRCVVSGTGVAVSSSSLTSSCKNSALVLFNYSTTGTTGDFVIVGGNNDATASKDFDSEL